MATADTAKLIASLTLDDKGFTKGLGNAEKKLGSLESTAFRVGQNIGSGVRTGITNIAKLGVVAAGGIAVAVKSGLDDLAELENAVTSVDGAIAQLGLTGQLTGKQIAGWANDIEADVDAAFDDKAITQAATTLLRFGKVTPKTLKPALVVMTDLAAKTGDIDSAATLLAKSLADPTKAAGKLARVGIILTKQQQDQIKAMTEAGDVAGAQAVLLDALAKSTGGAAKAMAGPYQDAINKTNDAIEDARKALAVGFLPVITKVADKLSKIAADPKALASIESFGKTLAGGLDHLIGIAENLPWDAIGTSLQLGGMGAKAILDAFVSLPPWIQTAVLTGWGLNKLTGGALSGIVGTLASGLIKGILGINAGVVNINAATVNGGGGPGGGGTNPVAAAGKGILGLGAAALGALTIAAFAPIATSQLAIALAGGPEGVAERDRRGRQDTADRRGIPGQVPDERPHAAPSLVTDKEVAKIAGQQAAAQVHTNDRLDAIKAEQAANALKIANQMPPIRSEMIRVREAQAAGANKIAAEMPPIRSEMIRVREAQKAIPAIFARESASERASIARAAQQQVAAQSRTTHAAQQSAAAIRDKRFSVTNNITIPLRVTVSDQVKATLRYQQLHRTPS